MSMDRPLVGKTVVLGITGSIAAYKGVEVARRLMDLGAEVHATITSAGVQFITPLTLRTLTGNPVTTDMFEDPNEWDVKHVSLARRASAIVVAPATADAIARLALGLADEFIYACALATRAPLIIAPAMNEKMFLHKTVKDHLQTLRDRGAHVVEPETGRLASGDVGLGRLADPAAVTAAVVEIVGYSGKLRGVKFLITAGPTREPLDPVRYISNRSSGKMGYALAEAVVSQGGDVTLVSGPTALATSLGCEFRRVETTEQMHEEVMKRFAGCDVFIAAAAPADYAPSSTGVQKMKKRDAGIEVDLELTPDILAECGRRKNTGQIVVGFAAETENLIDNAERKLREKKLDLIVANDVARTDIGFGADENAGMILLPSGRQIELPQMPKREFAERIIEAIVEQMSPGAG